MAPGCVDGIGQLLRTAGLGPVGDRGGIADLQRQPDAAGAAAAGLNAVDLGCLLARDDLDGGGAGGEQRAAAGAGKIADERQTQRVAPESHRCRVVVSRDDHAELENGGLIGHFLHGILAFAGLKARPPGRLTPVS